MVSIWNELQIKQKHFIIRTGYEVYECSKKVSSNKQLQSQQMDYERQLIDLRRKIQESQDEIEQQKSNIRNQHHVTDRKLQEQQDEFRRQRMDWRRREQDLQEKIKKVEGDSLDIALRKVREHMSGMGQSYKDQIETLQGQLSKWQNMYDEKQKEVSQLVTTIQEQSLHTTAYAKSQKKGEAGEYEVLSVLADSFFLKGMEIIDTSKQGGVGDIQVIDPKQNVRCMVEVKNYDSRSVPTKEVIKCERDVRTTKEISCCVMISLGSPITGHVHEDIGWVTDDDGMTKPILYLQYREELQRIGMWIHILMYLTRDVHQRLTADIENKTSMIQLVEYQKDINDMIEKMRPLKKAVQVMKQDMGKQIQNIDGLIHGMMQEALQKMSSRGILVQETVTKKSPDVNIQEWREHVGGNGFRGIDLTKYLKEKGITGKRIYTIRDKNCIKMQVGIQGYETYLPSGCKVGDIYYKMKSQ